MYMAAIVAEMIMVESHVLIWLVTFHSLLIDCGDFLLVLGSTVSIFVEIPKLMILTLMRWKLMYPGATRIRGKRKDKKEFVIVFSLQWDQQ